MGSQHIKTQITKKEYEENQGASQNKLRRIDSRVKLIRLGEFIGSRYQEQDLKMLVQILKDIIYKKQVERKTDLQGQVAPISQKQNL
jgi:hypothetical protein